jgi:hypothetical protein
MTTRTEAHQILGLAPGEIYHGLVLADDGETFEHLVESAPIHGEFTHADAIAVAQKAGYRLATRREGLILAGNKLSEGTRNGWFWLLEGYGTDSPYAWEQDFGHGIQETNRKGCGCNVRAVRRIPVGRLA